MTKYVFITLQLFLFCFVAFDFSQVAFAASSSSNCGCDAWNYQCISACRGPAGAGATTAPRSRSRATTSAKPKAKPAADQTCDITCSIPGQEPQRVGGKCGCYTPSDAEALQGQNQNQNQSGSGNTNNPALTEAVNKCNTARTQAMTDCDQDQDTGMQGAQSALTNFATQAGSMGMGACTKLAPVLAGANAATVYFNQNCSSGRASCLQTCTQARTRAAEAAGSIDAGYLAHQQELIDAYYDECKKLDAKVTQSQAAITNMVQAIPGVSNCATSTNTDLYSYCTSNPTALGCETVATDCSNPQVAASNQICICKNNPNANGCIGAQAKVADMNGAGGSADVSSLANATGASGSTGSDNLFGNVGDAGNMTPSKDKAAEIGGKMGKGANLGDGGGGAPGGGSDGKGGAAAQAAQVNAGFRGGGGGGGGWGSGGYGNGGYGEDRPYDPKDPKAAAAGGPDLKQFLPGGKMDPKTANRGLAGISGPDGITGPHSDIWKKIQNRYQIKTSELMP